MHQFLIPERGSTTSRLQVVSSTIPTPTTTGGPRDVLCLIRQQQTASRHPRPDRCNHLEHHCTPVPSVSLSSSSLSSSSCHSLLSSAAGPCILEWDEFDIIIRRERTYSSYRVVALFFWRGLGPRQQILALVLLTVMLAAAAAGFWIFFFLSRFDFQQHRCSSSRHTISTKKNCTFANECDNTRDGSRFTSR